MEESGSTPTALISAEETQRRRKASERGDAHNRIEGIYRDPRTDDIVEAYIRGEVRADELIPLFKARLEPS